MQCEDGEASWMGPCAAKGQGNCHGVYWWRAPKSDRWRPDPKEDTKRVRGLLASGINAGLAMCRRRAEVFLWEEYAELADGAPTATCGYNRIQACVACCVHVSVLVSV